MNKLPILLRPANSEDVPFVFNAWLKSFRNSQFAKPMLNEIFYAEHHKVIEKILNHYDVIVACNEEDKSQIYGFICAGYTENIFTLHYVYVKQPFRKMGIGTALLNGFEHTPEYTSVYTHQSKLAERLAEKYNMIYHPYVAMCPEEYMKKEQE